MDQKIARQPAVQVHGALFLVLQSGKRQISKPQQHVYQGERGKRKSQRQKVINKKPSGTKKQFVQYQHLPKQVMPHQVWGQLNPT